MLVSPLNSHEIVLSSILLTRSMLGMSYSKLTEVWDRELLNSYIIDVTFQLAWLYYNNVPVH